ncbi:HEAT repeat domain-containing protein [Streptomyces sp. NBC_00059]|uniref:HEAT repeat domain-containing protein n=1 Tax=Streptomyces sp. NBC_00059 TaxID=2975635 RepID=UPI00225C1831|nr:HEAT repeat domain-containing protein [Streptomyces sp. NBC_00059]MCX5414395.1 HEAT repeat domain-containing protein [Streptomyces sp. NBC_00059]
MTRTPADARTHHATRRPAPRLVAERLDGPHPPTAPADLAALAELLPHDVPRPPEESLLLAGLYGRLGTHLPGGRFPPWREAGMPVRVRIAWMRAELLTRPSALRDERPGELLYQAVRSIDAGDAARPDLLVAELAGTGDPVLRTEAVRLIRQGLHAGLLAPGLARTHLDRLLDAGASDVRPGDQAVAAAVLEELAQPWAASDPLPQARIAPYLAPGRPVPVAVLALDAAVRHGHGRLLAGVAADTSVPPLVRRAAMERLGGPAERGDIGALLDIAAQDPLLLGGPAVTCLQGLHRRGHFPEESQAPAVVGLALADHSIDPRTVATILYTCRTAVLGLLVDAPPDDPGWPRRIALLVALAEQGTGELPIGAALTRLLSSARFPGPFLEAIRELRYEEAEEAVLGLLSEAPEEALRTLEAIGGPRTVATLTRALGPSADGRDIAVHLRPVRHRAVELLWRLNTDPGLRRDLLARLDPAALPPAVAADLGAPDERELALLHARPDPPDPVAALCALAAHGSAATLPAVAALLLRTVGELAASWETVETGAQPEPARSGEPVVPPEIVHAIRGLGARLYERRRIRPSCLLDAPGPGAAGDALLADMVLDLLERPGLPARQQAILLEALRHAPSARARPRVHRLLRHPDPQVRKQAIALLARDAEGEDAQALSATLIALTRADDIQTVRQALLALGHARARWACPAIMALLGHPTMNIRKTAATVLARAGTPAAVPGLLHTLGHHDNPGLRAEAVTALGAILGGARTATVLAAAARARDPRERTLLLRSLDRLPASRTVLALAEQGSPVVPGLLALLADGRIGLGSGSAADLAELSAAHGITWSADVHGAPSPAADADLLLTHGWNATTALRIAESPDVLDPARLRGLRPMLAAWLGLARSSPAAAAGRVLGLVLRMCPAPWTDDERRIFAGSVRVLADGLAGDRERRPGLLAVLRAVAPLLPGAERAVLADAVRTMSPAPHLLALLLLKACGAVLTGDDLHRALTAARLDTDAPDAETSVLREAFGAPAPHADGDAEAWRTELRAAVRTGEALEEFRRLEQPTSGSRHRLSALMEVYPEAGDDRARTLLVDWMTALQPLDVPPWTLAETTGPASEVVRARDLDQPRSAAQRTRLLEMLDAADAGRRDAAATRLLDWPEPEAARAVLDAYLRGRVRTPPGSRLARALAVVGPAGPEDGDVLPGRVVGLARHLGPWDLVPFVPLLLGWWEDGPAALRAETALALRSAPADVLADHLRTRLEAGAWGFLDLLAGQRLSASPEMTRVRDRLRAEGRDDLADGLLLDEGPGSSPRTAAPPAAVHRPGRTELLDLARSGGPEQIRRALSRLVEEHGGRSADQDPGLKDVIGVLLTHPRPKVRLHAHRTSRAMLDRPTHLLHTAVLLDDPQPDISRMAIRTLCHASWEPAVPAVVALLGHPHPAVRAEAADGLLLMGPAAVPALRHAAARARPDKRSRYTGVLDRLTGAGGEGAAL